MGLITHGQIMNDPIYGQILFKYCLSKVFKLKLGHNQKILFLEVKRATGKEIAKHVIQPAKVIPACCVKARCAQLPTNIHRLWKDLKSVELRKDSTMVGNRKLLVLI